MNSKDGNGLISGIKWIAFGRLSAQLITWAMTFLVLRLLNPSDYGLVALSLAITSVFGLIAEFGLSSAIVQARLINRRQQANLFGYGILLNLGIAALLVSLAPFVLNFYDDKRLPLVIQVASIQFLFAIFSMLPDARMRREMKFKFMAKMEFCLSLVAGVVTLVLAYMGFDYWALVVSPLVVSFLRMVALNVTSKEWIAPKFSLLETQSLLKFGGVLLLARIAGHFLSQSDVLIAGIFLSAADLGIYAVAMQLASMPLSKVMMVINQIAFPELSRMNREEGMCTDALLRGGKLVAFILFPLLWGLAALAPFVVRWLMGEKWLAAVLPLQLVCLALPFRAISTMLTTAVSAAGRPDIELANTLTGCLLFPTLFYFGVQYGVEGLAWAWIVGAPIFVYLNMVRSGRTLGISSYRIFASFLIPIGCAAAMYMTLILLQKLLILKIDNFLDLIYSLLFGSIIYTTLMAIFDRKSFLFFVEFLGIKRR